MLKNPCATPPAQQKRRYSGALAQVQASFLLCGRCFEACPQKRACTLFLSLLAHLVRGAGNRTRAARSQTANTTIMLRPVYLKSASPPTSHHHTILTSSPAMVACSYTKYHGMGVVNQNNSLYLDIAGDVFQDFYVSSPLFFINPHRYHIQLPLAFIYILCQPRFYSTK